jgi:hypothetical protein
MMAAGGAHMTSFHLDQMVAASVPHMTAFGQQQQPSGTSIFFAGQALSSVCVHSHVVASR